MSPEVTKNGTQLINILIISWKLSIVLILEKMLIFVLQISFFFTDGDIHMGFFSKRTYINFLTLFLISSLGTVDMYLSLPSPSPFLSPLSL